jgi:hypothetical protein
MKTIGQVAKETWQVFRKPTTPVHVLFGLVCAFLCYAFGGWLGLLLMAVFAGWELWNDWELLRRNQIYREWGYAPHFDERNREIINPYGNLQKFYVPEGAMDFWESTIGFMIGVLTLGILQALHVIHISFWIGVI